MGSSTHNLAVAGKGLPWIGRKELHPFAQLVLMDIQVPRRLRHTHSAILDLSNGAQYCPPIGVQS